MKSLARNLLAVSNCCSSSTMHFAILSTLPIFTTILLPAVSCKGHEYQTRYPLPQPDPVNAVGKPRSRLTHFYRPCPFPTGSSAAADSRRLYISQETFRRAASPDTFKVPACYRTRRPRNVSRSATARQLIDTSCS